MSASVRPIIAGRPVLGFDRDAIRRRNRHAFAAGDQCRRLELAERLRALADAIVNGEANELVEQQAQRTVGLWARGRR